MTVFTAIVTVLAAPEGGAPWLYALLASVACIGALYIRSKKQIRIPRPLLGERR